MKCPACGRFAAAVADEDGSTTEMDKWVCGNDVHPLGYLEFYR